MRAYYARPINLYGTDTDRRALALIASLGWSVSDPNMPETQQEYETRGMEVFKELIEGADILVFRSAVDFKIPAGVAKEIMWAKGFNLPVIEIPSRVLSRRMSIEETREYLSEVGQR